MSYSFNLDYSLPIHNIRDIVNINIVPSTSVVNEGQYVNIQGYMAIDGEYVAMNGVQYLFNERLPIDITMPSEGCVGEISTDVLNFDYTIQSNMQLELNLNLAINGYEDRFETTGAVDEIEYLVETQGVDIEEDIDLGVMNEEDDINRLDNQPLSVEPVLVEDPILMPVIENEVVELVEGEMPSATVLEDDVVAPLEGVQVEAVEANFETVTLETPAVEVEVTPTVENVVIENVNVENVFPFVSQPTVQPTITAEKKSKIFDMLYELDKEAEEVEMLSKQANEELEVDEIVIDTPLETVEVNETVDVTDDIVDIMETPVQVGVTEEIKDVFGHFSDGESKIKIVFIQDEMITIDELSDRYSVEKACIEGLNSQDTDVFRSHERVMIRYGR